MKLDSGTPLGMEGRILASFHRTKRTCVNEATEQSWWHGRTVQEFLEAP